MHTVSPPAPSRAVRRRTPPPGPHRWPPRPTPALPRIPRSPRPRRPAARRGPRTSPTRPRPTTRASRRRPGAAAARRAPGAAAVSPVSRMSGRPRPTARPSSAPWIPPAWWIRSTARASPRPRSFPSRVRRRRAAIRAGSGAAPSPGRARRPSTPNRRGSPWGREGARGRAIRRARTDRSFPDGGGSVEGDEAHRLVPVEPGAPVQKPQLDHEGETDDCAAEDLDESRSGLDGSASGEEVVDDRDPLAGVHGIGVELERVDSVLEIVRLAHRAVRQLAGLAGGHETESQAVGDRAREEKPAGVDAQHLAGIALGDPVGQRADGVAKEPRVEEQRGDVLEGDPRLREIGDVADRPPEPYLEVRRRRCGLPAHRSARCGRTVRGSTVPPFQRTSKWRWSPVALPVCPTIAIGWPRRTCSPTLTRFRSWWA